jgi:hypothetical protein
MTIDYSQSVRQVYMQTVDYVLHQRAKLDIICAGAFAAENIQRLLSWTRDWNADTLRFRPILGVRGRLPSILGFTGDFS